LWEKGGTRVKNVCEAWERIEKVESFYEMLYENRVLRSGHKGFGIVDEGF